MHLNPVRLNVINIVADELSGSDPVLLQQSKHDMSKPFLAPDKDHKCKSPLVSVGGKPLNRNLVVRSPYFQQKLLDNDDHVNKEQKFTSEEDTSGTRDCMAPENGLLVSKFFKNSIKGRKSISTKSIQNVCIFF